MRNILIVELGGQTRMSGPALQAMSNIELVKLGLGKPQPGGLNGRAAGTWRVAGGPVPHAA